MGNGRRKKEERGRFQMEYTVIEVSEMFGVTPRDISAMVAKGGIKGMRVLPSDTGIEYILNDQSVDQIGALLGKSPKAEEDGDINIRDEICEGMMDAFIRITREGLLTDAFMKALDSDEFMQRINKAVFSALKGMKALEERDLVPQRWGDERHR